MAPRGARCVARRREELGESVRGVAPSFLGCEGAPPRDARQRDQRARRNAANQCSVAITRTCGATNPTGAWRDKEEACEVPPWQQLRPCREAAAPDGLGGVCPFANEHGRRRILAAATLECSQGSELFDAEASFSTC